MTQANPPAAFRKHVFALLGECYGDKTLVLCPTVFVKLLNGDHKAAILLSQILYWSDRTKDPDGWFYKSYADWQRETGLSEAQVRRIVNGDPRVQSPQVTLRDLGVETRLRKVKRTGAPTLHYRINQARFLGALHAVLGQGDSPHCAASIPSNDADQPSALPGMYSEQCAVSSLDPETNSQQISAGDQPSPNPTHQPDEDSDLAVFFPFEGRFGKLKDQFKAPFRVELERLGAAKAGEVLDRCATRGRSWAYVLRAFANETTARVSQESVVETRWGGWESLDSDQGLLAPEAPESAPVAVSERLQTPWERFGSTSTVQDAWSAAIGQLEFQLDRGSFDTFLRGTILVDFELETRTFVLVARNAYTRDMLQHRLNRMVKRIVGDVYGQPVEVRYLLEAEWVGQRERIA